MALWLPACTKPLLFSEFPLVWINVHQCSFAKKLKVRGFHILVAVTMHMWIYPTCISFSKWKYSHTYDPKGRCDSDGHRALIWIYDILLKGSSDYQNAFVGIVDKIENWFFQRMRHFCKCIFLCNLYC